MAHSNSQTGLLSSVIQRQAFRQELYGDMKGDRSPTELGGMKGSSSAREESNAEMSVNERAFGTQTGQGSESLESVGSRDSGGKL